MFTMFPLSAATSFANEGLLFTNSTALYVIYVPLNPSIGHMFCFYVCIHKLGLLEMNYQQMNKLRKYYVFIINIINTLKKPVSL